MFGLSSPFFQHQIRIFLLTFVTANTQSIDSGSVTRSIRVHGRSVHVHNEAKVTSVKMSGWCVYLCVGGVCGGVWVEKTVIYNN